MPTTTVKTIGTGGDYTTLASWESACPADLTATDEIWNGKVKQEELTGSNTLLTLSGITTDATRYVVLEADTGASWRDNGSVRTTAFAYSASYASCRSGSNYAPAFLIQVNHTTIRNLQFKNTGSDMTMRVTASNVTVDNCILQSVGTGNGLAFNGTAGKARNCLILAAGTAVNVNHYSTASEVHGCTLVKTGSAGGTGISRTGGDAAPLIKNTAVFNFTTLTSGTMSGSSGYNATDLSSGLPGSNNVHSLTYSDQFENTSSDWRAKSTGGLVAAGTPDATNLPTDASGFTRSATTPTVGAWEVDGGGGAAGHPAGRRFGLVAGCRPVEIGRDGAFIF